jgi:hypothetical protein
MRKNAISMGRDSTYGHKSEYQSKLPRKDTRSLAFMPEPGNGESGKLLWNHFPPRFVSSALLHDSLLATSFALSHKENGYRANELFIETLEQEASFF